MSQESWDRFFLQDALHWARRSKDPNTQVGAVIVGPDREVRSTGFNGFPRGVEDTSARLVTRDTKLKLMVHAECNAILNAARIGVSVKGCTLYFAATDTTGATFGGCPCTRCSLEIIQSGISTLVSYPVKDGFSKWAEDLDFAKVILDEVGMPRREVKP